MRISSNMANLLCSILCFLLVKTGIPEDLIFAINEPLLFAYILSAIIRIFAPRLWAKIIEFVITGFVIE